VGALIYCPPPFAIGDTSAGNDPLLLRPEREKERVSKHGLWLKKRGKSITGNHFRDCAQAAGNGKRRKRQECGWKPLRDGGKS